MSRALPTPQHAVEIAARIGRGRQKMGQQFAPPYGLDTLCDVLLVLWREGNFDAPTKEELTKVKRQYNALNARYQKLRQQFNELAGVDSPAEEDVDNA